MCAYVCFLNLKVFLYNSVKPEPQRGVLVVWTLQGIQYQKSRCSWCSFFSLRYHKSMGCFIQQWRPIKKWLFWEKCFKASRLLRQANSENVAHYKSPKGKNCYVVCFSRTRKSNPAWGFEHPKEVELTSTWVFLVADTLNFLCFNPLALQMWHSETLDGGFNVFFGVPKPGSSLSCFRGFQNLVHAIPKHQGGETHSFDLLKLMSPTFGLVFQ